MGDLMVSIRTVGKPRQGAINLVFISCNILYLPSVRFGSSATRLLVHYERKWSDNEARTARLNILCDTHDVPTKLA